MKIICIDASKGDFVNYSGFELVEGDIYTVDEIFIGERTKERCYRLKEDPIKGGYMAKRFIPLSNIDETQQVNKEAINHEYKR